MLTRGCAVPLAPYSESYWYPDGSLASGVEYHVFPRTSNVHAVLFADQAGTVPLPNPGTTDANGLISFFVENGDHWLFIRGQAFYVIVDLDPNLTHVWPATFQWEQTTPDDVWMINHGLSTKPAVTVLDPADQLIEGDVQYTDDNSLTITFGAPISGTAYLRR